MTPSTQPPPTATARPPSRASARRPAAGLALLLPLCACADWGVRPMFPEAAARQPVVQEQALLGLSPAGDAAAAQMLLAEGEPPQLSLLVLDRGGGPGRLVLVAPPEAARAVAGELLRDGKRLLPLLAPAVAREWPEALATAGSLGFARAAPAVPEPGRRRWPITGATGLQLALRLSELEGPPPAVGLLLTELPGGQPGGAEEVELCRMPLAGEVVSPRLWLAGRTAWLLAGSVRGGTSAEALHRTVGLRRGDLLRAEAGLHNLHGLSDYGQGDLDAAGREFARALAADDRFVDALYNAASVAALADRTDEAIDLLRRAVAEDPRRVQVLARDDDDLKGLRRRADVRALLGLRRLPPADREPPR